jgi:hypothetical protein
MLTPVTATTLGSHPYAVPTPLARTAVTRATVAGELPARTRVRPTAGPDALAACVAQSCLQGSLIRFQQEA